jgi:hypothetical protein
MLGRFLECTALVKKVIKKRQRESECIGRLTYRIFSGNLPEAIRGAYSSFRPTKNSYNSRLSALRNYSIIRAGRAGPHGPAESRGASAVRRAKLES